MFASVKLFITLWIIGMSIGMGFVFLLSPRSFKHRNIKTLLMRILIGLSLIGIGIFTIFNPNATLTFCRIFIMPIVTVIVFTAMIVNFVLPIICHFSPKLNRYLND